MVSYHLTNMAAGSHLWFSPLSQFLQTSWRNLVETIYMNFSQRLDVSAPKRFRLVNNVTIPLSHILRDSWSDVFETCLICSTIGLVVSSWTWLRSVDNYGRRPPCCIFTIIGSSPKQQEYFVQTLHTNYSQCLNASHWKWLWSINKYGRTWIDLYLT